MSDAKLIANAVELGLMICAMEAEFEPMRAEAWVPVWGCAQQALVILALEEAA